MPRPLALYFESCVCKAAPSAARSSTRSAMGSAFDCKYAAVKGIPAALAG